MKHFLYRLGLFFSIIISFVIILKCVEGDRLKTNEYVAALTDKHQRIDQIKQPKLILAGGSNLVFGVDSQKIENELGIPVANLGLLAKLGLRFILNELEDVAEKGDVILLSLEHDMTIDGNSELQKMTSYYNSFARKYYKEVDQNWFTDIAILIEDSHMLFKKTISGYVDKMQANNAYRRDGLNIYGDGIYHLDQPSQSVLGSKSIITNNKDEEIKLLNDFYKKMQQKDIRVVFSYGTYEISEFEKNKKALQKVHRDLKAYLQIEMIMDLKDFVYPTANFYDSVYHLNKSGRKVHTKNLISQLQNSKIITRNFQTN